MITRPYHDDWLVEEEAIGSPPKKGRFPLEWIEHETAKAVPEAGKPEMHSAAHQGRKPRRLAWTVAALGWLCGFVMGAVIVGVSLFAYYAPKQKPTMGQQLAFTAGYRALHKQPIPMMR